MVDKTDWRILVIIESIKDCIESAEKSGDEDLNSYIIAYAGALKIIQEQLSDEERKQFKLDFDIDEKYM